MKRFRNLPMLNPPPCADVRASWTPNQTNTIVARAMRSEGFLEPQPNQTQSRQGYDDVDPHRRNGGCGCGCQRTASLCEIVKQTCAHFPCPPVSSSRSICLREQIRSAATGCCDVAVVVGLVTC